VNGDAVGEAGKKPCPPDKVCTLGKAYGYWVSCEVGRQLARLLVAEERGVGEMTRIRTTGIGLDADADANGAADGNKRFPKPDNLHRRGACRGYSDTSRVQADGNGKQGEQNRRTSGELWKDRCQGQCARIRMP
jgi:hypothetical protein